jgi:tripartite ATP-independent transporter DctP family solute receptor
MFSKKSILLTMAILMVFSCFIFSISYAADAPIVLKLAHADATDVFTSRKHAQCMIFANLVNARGGGRIEVQVYGAGALGAEREYVEAIMAGTVQAGIASGVMGGFLREAMVTDIPYLFPSASIAWKVLDGPFGDKLSDLLLEKTGLRNLAFAEVGFRHFTNDVRPIKSPVDVKGLKIRVQENPLFMTLIKALGGNPTPIAWTEVYTALQTGVVDGHENPISSTVFAKIYEVQKYLTLDGHVYGVDWFIINNKFFKSLPEDLQYIIVDCAIISSVVGRGLQQLNSNVVGYQTVKDYGMEIYAPTEEEMAQFRAAAQGPVIEWLKTEISIDLINEALEVVEKTVEEQKALIK